MHHLNNFALLLCISAILGASVKRLKADEEDSLEEMQAISNDSQDLRIEERTIRYEEVLPLDPLENNQVVGPVGPDVAITRIARSIYNVASSMSFAESSWAYLLKGVISMVFGYYGNLLMPAFSSAAVMLIRSLT